MTGVAPYRVPVEVRRGQLWEFGIDDGPVLRARVLRVTMPIFGTRYVFLKRVSGGRSMRVPLRRLQHQLGGARFVEEAPAVVIENKSRSAAEVEPPPPSTKVHEPRMSVSDRRQAVARAHVLRARGRTVPQIADVFGVMPEVVEVWLAEDPTDGT